MIRNEGGEDETKNKIKYIKLHKPKIPDVSWTRPTLKEMREANVFCLQNEEALSLRERENEINKATG